MLSGKSYQYPAYIYVDTVKEVEQRSEAVVEAFMNLVKPYTIERKGVEKHNKREV